MLERDYLLSWILAGIARVNTLQEWLIFKGGTALKKCYFGEYRFCGVVQFIIFSIDITFDPKEITVGVDCQALNMHLVYSVYIFYKGANDGR